MPWLADFLAHPSRDQFWRQLVPSRDLDRVTVPALHIGGWYDLFLAQGLRSYERLRGPGRGAAPNHRAVVANHG